MANHTITRVMTLDAGHRVPDHKSRCRSPHGHTYRVECSFSCTALAKSGAAAGMVADFGEIKRLMETQIHEPCDHKMILYVKDTLLPSFLGPDGPKLESLQSFNALTLFGMNVQGVEGIQLHVVNFIPTAENLARYWFEQLRNALMEDLQFGTGAGFMVERIRVWETPNCFADYEIAPHPPHRNY